VTGVFGMATLYFCLRLDSRRRKGSNAIFVLGAGCGGRVFETAVSVRWRLLSPVCFGQCLSKWQSAGGALN
jgi:hypothetical protein